MKHLLVFLVVSWLCIGTSNALGENRVVIINELGGSRHLKVQCKSRDDNLGQRYLRPRQEYGFSFGDNIFLSTLFWCHLWQGPDWRHHQVIVAYESTWSDWPRVTYKWVARDDGIYFTMSRKPPQKKFAWDTPINDKRLSKDD